MIKSLNKAYQTDSMYYWCNAEGEVNYPGSGFSTGDSCLLYTSPSPRDN